MIYLVGEKVAISGKDEMFRQNQHIQKGHDEKKKDDRTAGTLLRVGEISSEFVEHPFVAVDV